VVRGNVAKRERGLIGWRSSRAGGDVPPMTAGRDNPGPWKTKRADDESARRTENHTRDQREESDPIRFKPRGAGGLRNPVLESRPGPEATVIEFAFQLGARLFEFGHLYEVS